MQNICSKDFYKKNSYNFETQNQLWCSQITDAHDNFCGCHYPFAHLLSTIFPPGHTDRDLTITQILTRDYTELCLSGGQEEKDGCGTETDHTTKERDITENQEENLTEEGIEELIAAVDDAEAR